MNDLFLLRISLALTVLLSLCMALVICVARQQPLPPRLAMLHLTDCELPCWIGIMPGVTPADQVKARIKAVYGEDSRYRITDQMPGELTVGSVDDPSGTEELAFEWLPNDQGNVLRLVIYSNLKPDIGDMVHLVGRPKGVDILASEFGKLPGLLYENTLVGISIPQNGKPFPDLFSVTVDFHDNIGSITIGEVDGTVVPGSRWRGFDVAYNVGP